MGEGGLKSRQGLDDLFVTVVTELETIGSHTELGYKACVLLYSVLLQWYFCRTRVLAEKKAQAYPVPCAFWPCTFLVGSVWSMKRSGAHELPPWCGAAWERHTAHATRYNTYRDAVGK